MADENVQDLIERVRRGDMDALADLIARYQDRMLPLVRRRMTPDLQALTQTQSIVDSVFMQAPDLFQEFEFKGEEALLQYLAKVAAFKLSDRRDYLRAAKRGGGKQLAGGTVAQDLLAAKSAGGPTPSEAYSDKEQAGRLKEALAQLEPSQRSAIVLRYYEKLQLREVGERLGISEDAARMKIARAETALARVYDENGWASP